LNYSLSRRPADQTIEHAAPGSARYSGAEGSMTSFS